MSPPLHCIPTRVGQALVQVARRTLQERFGLSPDAAEAPRLEAMDHPALQVKAGTFVTLTLDGRLRGCIGSLVGHEPVIEGVRHNAVNAAFNDPRFPALSAQELPRVRIDVSVLTPPQRLPYEDPEDLTAKLRPHIDGVILRKGFCCATFLPQVWEQLARPEDFLAHLCRKAGLAADAWRNSKLEVEVYQVQCFEETPC